MSAQEFVRKLGRRFMEHPLTRGLNQDDPQTTELRKPIPASEPFLRAIYDVWYSKLTAETSRCAAAAVCRPDAESDGFRERAAALAKGVEIPSDVRADRGAKKDRRHCSLKAKQR